MGTSRYTAGDIANYFIYRAKEDQELISNLKLQKLVYYAQGLHLVLFGKPIFQEKIKAWAYGPVIPELYQKYKKYGPKGIPADKKFKPISISGEMREHLDEVYTVFGQFSAMRLMELTHTDTCWENAHPDKIITHKSMKESLRKYIKNG